MSWKDSEKWKKMQEGTDCPFCEDIHLSENEHSFLVQELEVSYVRLPKNQYVKGHVIVVLKRHATELFQLSEKELHTFWDEVALVAKAVQHITSAVKINYVVLGNKCPHVHCTILPRQIEDDSNVLVRTDEKVVLLTLSEYQSLISNLQQKIMSRV